MIADMLCGDMRGAAWARIDSGPPAHHARGCRRVMMMFRPMMMKTTQDHLPLSDAPLLECYDRMKDILDLIASQHLTSEMDNDQAEHADYEGAYNEIVLKVREALS